MVTFLIMRITTFSIVIGLKKILLSTNLLAKLLSESLLLNSQLSDSSISQSHSRLQFKINQSHLKLQFKSTSHHQFTASFVLSPVRVRSGGLLTRAAASNRVYNFFSDVFTVGLANINTVFHSLQARLLCRFVKLKLWDLGDLHLNAVCDNLRTPQYSNEKFILNALVQLSDAPSKKKKITGVVFSAL